MQQVTKYLRCPERAKITEHSLPMTPWGPTNKPKQTVHKSQNKESKPQQGNRTARQDPLNTTIRQRTAQNSELQQSHKYSSPTIDVHKANENGAWNLTTCKNINVVTQEKPQAQSIALKRFRKKERWGTDNDEM